MSDDEFDFNEGGLSGEILLPSPGGPFSAITPSMWPQDILSQINQSKDYDSKCTFDEFGFRVDEKNSDIVKDLQKSPFVEDSQKR